jgi:PAS domain S-box-containing protein
MPCGGGAPAAGAGLGTRVRRLSTFTRVIILTAFYFIGGLLGRESSFLNGEVSLVWPPSGIALAAILLFGYEFWPGVALGALLVATLTVTPLSFAMGTAVGSAVGAVVCTYLLQRFVQFRPSLERVRDVAGMVVLGSIMGTTVNAAFNAGSLCLGGELSWDKFADAWIVWWVPNAMANLVVAPAILSWGSDDRRRWSWPRILEASACGGLLVLATIVSFESWYGQGVQSYPLAYLPYPFLVWLALRFGQRGATTGTLLVASLAIHALLRDRGPFFMGPDHERESLLLVGTYISVLSISNMLLAAVSMEREAAEASVRKSERRYRGVVEDQTELIFRFTPDGTLTFVNEAFCRYYGKCRGELLGHSFLPLVPEDDREIVTFSFQRLRPQEPLAHYDYRAIMPEGQVRWQHCIVRAIFDEQGAISEYQAVSQDITERKAAEEALRQSEERVRTILNSMVDGVLSIDVQGIVESFNPGAERIFGLAPAEILGRNIRSLLQADAQAEFEACLNLHLKRAPAQAIEVKALRRDGASFPVDLALSEMFLGSRRLFIAVVRDISERKRLEEQFRQAQKMEAVGRLAAGIAHDFNNLMQAILGYCNLLLRRLAANNGTRENLEQIEKAAQRAAGLTGKLLSFSRKTVLQPKVLNLNSVVLDMSQLLRRVLSAQISVATDLDSALGHVKADPGELEQAILNLVVNARDAMPRGGKLTIRTANFEVEPNPRLLPTDPPPGRYVMLSIADTGCGMEPEVKAHLFEPFFTTKEQGKGTGLGLSMVYGMVKQSDGFIQVESEVDRGTTFNIYFPCMDAPIDPSAQPSEAPALPQPPPPAQGRKTILLVEDEDIVRAMLMEVLQESGYSVLEAPDGEAALALSRQHSGPLDLLVTDLVMPNMTGRELSEQIRTDRPELKFLFMSGYTNDEVMRGEIASAHAAFLQKPFQPDALLTKVREIFEA